MNVHREICDWSRSRPDWQRDALRRLVQKGKLDHLDVEALTEICKGTNGLTSNREVVPLSEEHLPSGGPNSGSVSIHSIHHKIGVNALAENQILKFGPRLTVVYGENGAGKSGFARIFKSACRARGTEDILGNVFSETAHPSQIVTIEFRVGNGSAREWMGGDDEDLARVGVFDRHAETIYTTKETDVAFRPFGLDLFDKLVGTCDSVRERLEGERDSLRVSNLPKLALPEGTAAARFLANLSPFTTPTEVRELVTLSEDESNRIDLIKERIRDLESNHPENLVQELTLRSGRFRRFSQQLLGIESALSSQAVKSVIEAHMRYVGKREEAGNLRETAIGPDLLPGTGTADWTKMWEAGRNFSEKGAYPDRQFPFTDSGALCVLCQQKLNKDTTNRLTRFEQFATSDAEREARETQGDYEKLYREIEYLYVSGEGVEESIKDLRLDDNDLADAVENSVALAAERRRLIIEALENSTYPGELPELPSTSREVGAFAERLAARAEGLRMEEVESEKDSLVAELEDLRARQSLGEHKVALLSEIGRMRKISQFEQCIRDTGTHGITRKSTIITKEVVTHQLKLAFQEELDNLNFRDLKVEIVDAGGKAGSFFHKLVLSGAPEAELPMVVSEGQSRCLSIAAFFAELSTGDDSSTVLLDDPVSSLDDRWREKVAERIVNEAKERQVIVFTHDIFFLQRIRLYAERLSVDIQVQHVRHLGNVPGVCEDDLPWDALSVGKRIGHLRNEFQSAQRLFRDGLTVEYEEKARSLYSSLRSAWERAVEERLLNGVIERYRKDIQTKRIREITDICESDYNDIEVAMTKCSEMTEAHDRPPTGRLYVPEPNELKQDINKLDSWVKAIRDRRR